MDKFTRELRYTVLKHSDVTKALDPDEKELLIKLEEKVASYRECSGKPILECVVVESDWPEYEIVWDMIKNRVND